MSLSDLYIERVTRTFSGTIRQIQEDAKKYIFDNKTSQWVHVAPYSIRNVQFFQNLNGQQIPYNPLGFDRITDEKVKNVCFKFSREGPYEKKFFGVGFQRTDYVYQSCDTFAVKKIMRIFRERDRTFVDTDEYKQQMAKWDEENRKLNGEFNKRAMK